MPPSSIQARMFLATSMKKRGVTDASQVEIPRCDADCRRCLATRCVFRGLLPTWLEEVSKKEMN
jgi:hypothetical protein